MNNSSAIYQISMILCAVLLSCVPWFFGGLSSAQSMVLSILILAITLWITEALPLFVTSILSSLLLVIAAGLPAKQVFQYYFDPVIVLFLGGFTLALLLTKHGMDKIIANAVLRRFQGSGVKFLFGLMAATAFLSLWMSNTASAALMIPIGMSVLRSNNLGTPQSRLAKGTVLAIAYAATIGGIGSIIGSPPNAIAGHHLEKLGHAFGFLSWMGMALPFVIVSLVVTWKFMSHFFNFNAMQIQIEDSKISLNKNQRWVFGIFFLTVAGWLSTQFTGISSSMIALIPVILAFGSGLLKESDLGKISWPTLLLFGGGLSLGAAMSSSGLDTLLAQSLQPIINQFSLLPAIAALVFLGMGLSMVASNTASAAILIPLLLPLANSLGMTPVSIAVLGAIAVSIDFMMPVGTPPNAIAYSTGMLSMKEMISAGFCVNLLNAIILTLMFYLVF